MQACTRACAHFMPTSDGELLFHFVRWYWRRWRRWWGWLEAEEIRQRQNNQPSDDTTNSTANDRIVVLLLSVRMGFFCSLAAVVVSGVLICVLIFVKRRSGSGGLGGIGSGSLGGIGSGRENDTPD